MGYARFSRQMLSRTLPGRLNVMAMGVELRQAMRKGGIVHGRMPNPVSEFLQEICDLYFFRTSRSALSVQKARPPLAIQARSSSRQTGGRAAS